MPQKSPSNSIHTQKQMASAKLPDPPDFVFLRDQDRSHWVAIVSTREYRSWHESDLVQAAMLARTRADIEAVSRELDEVPNYVGEGASVRKHPLHQVLETLVRRNIALTKHLGLSTAATVAEKPNQTKIRNQAQRDIANMLEAHGAADPENLLARPN